MAADAPPRPPKTAADAPPPPRDDDTTDAVPRLLDYLETFPSDAGASELKDELSAFTHYDLRAACARLNVAMPKRQQKKGGYISALVSYWMALTPRPPPSAAAAAKAEVTPVAPSPRASFEEPVGMELPADVAQFVQLFPPHGHVEELKEQLTACRSRTLRSACVVLDLHPRKSFTKADFLGLLVSYWQDSSAVTPSAAAHEKDRDDAVLPSSLSSSSTKRVRARDEDGKKAVGKKPKQKKSVKEVERRDDDEGDDRSTDKWTAALEKAKVVKEWASAIEILSRVDGSAESIESIRSLIDSVVNSATSEL